jgi:hypothetical protein
LQEVLGRQPLYICGERHSPDFQTHAWLVCDGFVVDITADQFGQPPVIVARQSPWHDEWEQGPGRPPIITADQWPHYPSRAWAKIVAKLEKSPLHAEPHP